MALEKFACEPSLLSKVANHFSANTHAAPPVLDTDTISKIKSLERWMVGIAQTRYFSMALFDLLVHSSAPPYSFNGVTLAPTLARTLTLTLTLNPKPDPTPATTSTSNPNPNPNPRKTDSPSNNSSGVCLSITTM